MRVKNMATPHTRFQPMMAAAPIPFQARLMSASWLPVYTRPSSMKMGAASTPSSPPPPWIATASTGSSTPRRSSALAAGRCGSCARPGARPHLDRMM